MISRIRISVIGLLPCGPDEGCVLLYDGVLPAIVWLIGLWGWAKDRTALVQRRVAQASVGDSALEPGGLQQRFPPIVGAD